MSEAMRLENSLYKLKNSLGDPVDLTWTCPKCRPVRTTTTHSTGQQRCPACGTILLCTTVPIWKNRKHFVKLRDGGDEAN